MQSKQSPAVMKRKACAWRLHLVAAGSFCLTWFAIPSAGAQTAPTADLTFRMPGECMHRLQLSAEICADVLERAWRHYLRNTPRYVGRGDCWRVHRVCIVLPAERLRLSEKARFFTPFVWFAPPLWAIRLLDSEGRDFDVLVDQDMQPLPETGMTPTMPAGRFSPPAETVRRGYLQSLREAVPPAPAWGRSSGRPDPGPAPVLQGLGPADSYPVAPARARDMRERRRALSNGG
jgi:hypothetical protein